MKRSLVIVFVLFLSCFQVHGALQDIRLSKDSRVSLLTCGQGQDLYAVFGHSAVRVKDPNSGLDVVFNYGTFSFTSDFYFKFTMGKLNYMLSTSGFPGFYKGYVMEGRSVVEQILDINLNDRQALFDYLAENYKPENRYYLYDFFYNNCSTKIRDALKDVFGERLQWNKETKPGNPSFRQMIDQYLVKMDWSDFGIDLGLGLPCDVKPSYRDYMFLPDELLLAFDKAKFKDNASERNLVSEMNIIYKASPNIPRFPFYFRPFFLCWLLFSLVLLVSIVEWGKKRDYVVFDKGLFGFYGLFGFFLLFLWFITDHSATANNLNAIWAFPFYFPMCFFSFSKTTKNPSRYFFLAMGLISFLLVAFWSHLPQQLHAAAIPLTLAAGVRSLLFYLKSR